MRHCHLILTAVPKPIDNCTDTPRVSGTHDSGGPAVTVGAIAPTLRPGFVMRTFLFALCLTTAFSGTARGQEEPPIQSPQDAACRTDARDKVFTAANPNNLSLWDLGSQIYHTCMAAYHGRGPNAGRREQRF